MDFQMKCKQNIFYSGLFSDLMKWNIFYSGQSISLFDYNM
jgi:hypothetical protein